MKKLKLSLAMRGCSLEQRHPFSPDYKLGGLRICPKPALAFSRGRLECRRNKPSGRLTKRLGQK
jgi:hypothetical protein